MTLQELAELVVAEGPSRELDARIAAAVGWRVLYDDHDPNDREPYYQPDPDRSWTAVPRYTASLDAALTLVPETADYAGERFRLEHWNTNGVHAPHVRATAWVAGAPRVYAATPALALTAAALRGRARAQAPAPETGEGV